MALLYLSITQSYFYFFFFFSSRRRHTRLQGDWSSDVCSSDLPTCKAAIAQLGQQLGHVAIAALHVGVRRVLRVAAGRLVEAHRRQPPGLDVVHEVITVLQVCGAVLRARREARVVVEGLVMRLEVRAAFVA